MQIEWTLGAIGVSRCMKVGGSIGRYLTKDDPFCLNREPDDSKYNLDPFYKAVTHQ